MAKSELQVDLFILASRERFPIQQQLARIIQREQLLPFPVGHLEREGSLGGVSSLVHQPSLEGLLERLELLRSQLVEVYASSELLEPELAQEDVELADALACCIESRL